LAGKCRQRGENILGRKKIQPRHRLANLKNGARSDLRELCSSLFVQYTTYLRHFEAQLP